MTALAAIDAGLRQPDLNVLDRALLLLQRSRAYHARTITSCELIEALDSRPHLTPLDRSWILRLYPSACRGTLTSYELEIALDRLDRPDDK